jgi:hypothetical protein
MDNGPIEGGNVPMLVDGVSYNISIMNPVDGGRREVDGSEGFSPCLFEQSGVQARC